MRPVLHTPLQRQESQRAYIANSKDASATRHAYDSESGLVYVETEITGKKFKSHNWICELKTPNLVKRPTTHAAGARSLFNLAKIKSVREFRFLTLEHFEAIPWPIAQKLWNHIVSTHQESLHAWLILAKCYPRASDFARPEYRYYFEAKAPTQLLSSYIHGFSSPDPNPQFLIALRISPRQLSVPDLVSISKLTNLAVLDLSDGQPIRTPSQLESPLTDRIFNSWAELASEQKAFQHLRVLLLGWQDNVTSWVLQYMHYFPSLCYIICTDCRALHQKNRSEWVPMAQSHGWEALHAKRSVKALKPLLDDGEFVRGNVSNLYYHSHEVSGQGRSSSHGAETVLAVAGKSYGPNYDYDDDDDEDSDFANETGGTIGLRPVVEAWIGTPRPWTHIIEEFPGTRTVWLERVNPTKIQSHVHEPPHSKAISTSFRTQTRCQRQKRHGFHSSTRVPVIVGEDGDRNGNIKSNENKGLEEVSENKGEANLSSRSNTAYPDPSISSSAAAAAPNSAAKHHSWAATTSSSKKPSTITACPVGVGIGSMSSNGNSICKSSLSATATVTSSRKRRLQSRSKLTTEDLLMGMMSQPHQSH